MKNKKNVIIAAIAATITFGSLSLAKAKMYKHHYKYKTGNFEKGNLDDKSCDHHFFKRKNTTIE